MGLTFESRFCSPGSYASTLTFPNLTFHQNLLTTDSNTKKMAVGGIQPTRSTSSKKLRLCLFDHKFWEQRPGCRSGSCRRRRRCPSRRRTSRGPTSTCPAGGRCRCAASGGEAGKSSFRNPVQTTSLTWLFRSRSSSWLWLEAQSGPSALALI